MPRLLRAQIHDFLHNYHKAVFELEHNKSLVDARREQAEGIVHELLDQKFHYHFHQKVDTDRAETIQLIHNYCREALLPPVVGRLAERVLLLEQRHAKSLELVEMVLEKFSEQIDKDIIKESGGSA